MPLSATRNKAIGITVRRQIDGLGETRHAVRMQIVQRRIVVVSFVVAVVVEITIVVDHLQHVGFVVVVSVFVAAIVVVPGSLEQIVVVVFVRTSVAGCTVIVDIGYCLPPIRTVVHRVILHIVVVVVIVVAVACVRVVHTALHIIVVVVFVVFVVLVGRCRANRNAAHFLHKRVLIRRQMIVRRLTLIKSKLVLLLLVLL